MLAEYLPPNGTSLFVTIVLFMLFVPCVPCVLFVPVEGMVQCPLYAHVLICNYLAIPIKKTKGLSCDSDLKKIFRRNISPQTTHNCL